MGTDHSAGTRRLVSFKDVSFCLCLEILCQSQWANSQEGEDLEGGKETAGAVNDGSNE